MKVPFVLIHSLILTVGFMGCRSAQQYTPIDSASRSFSRPSTGKWDGQKTCPVTGETLGSMGAPVRVEANDQTVWVCCEGCVAAVKENPRQFSQQVHNEIGSPGRSATSRERTIDRSSGRSANSSSRGCH